MMVRRKRLVGDRRWRESRNVMMAACLALALIWVQAAVAAEYSGKATVLDIGLGARAMGMGGAFVAVADDASSVYYNPAGLADVQGLQLTSFYSNEYQVSSYGALGLATPGFGAAVFRLGSGDIPETDEFGNVIGHFDISQVGFLAGYGRRLGAVALGANVAYVTESLYEDEGKGFTGSVGALYSRNNLQFGAAIHNVFGELKYDDLSFAFASRSELGVAVKLTRLILSGQYEMNRTEENMWRFGAEFAVADNLRLRGGAAIGAETKQKDYSVGLGVKLGAFAIDYTYALPDHLPATQRFSLGVAF